MDYKQFNVHRWRYPDWIPSPIRSISCDPSTSQVAIGREDGTIEITCSNSKWHTLAWIHGQSDFKLQQIVYVTSGRLFGISLKGFLFEVDFSALELKNIRDCYGGSSWCIAASKRNQLLAVGCEDGTARIFTYEDDANNLEYLRTVPTTGSRVLCVAFHPLSPKLFLGCTDGTIRCVDETSGRSLFRMTGDILRGVPTRIWSLVVLSDSTIISGDSRGHVQFWDGQIGVLMATIQQHTAEVLALAVSPDESQVFASGTDSRVTCMKKVSIPPSDFEHSSPPMENGTQVGIANIQTVKDDNSSATATANATDRQWVHTTAQRPHSHDVFALAVVADATGGRLVSGGLDCKLCVYSLASFAQTRPSWILPIPAQGLVCATLKDDCTGWSVVRHRTHLDIWALRGRVSGPISVLGPDTAHTQQLNEGGTGVGGGVDIVSDDKPCTLALRLEVKDTSHLRCCATARVINEKNGGMDSSMIVIASGDSGCRIWQLQLSDPKPGNGDVNTRGLEGRVKSIRRLTIPKAANVSCTALCLSGDGRLAVLATSTGFLLLLDICYTFDEADIKDDDDETTQDDALADAGVAVSVTVRHVFPHRQNVSSLLSASATSSTSSVVGVSGLTGLGSGLGLDGAVVQIALSSDGLWLAVSDASVRGRVYVYDLDRLCLHWTLPRSAAPVTSLGFHPTSPTSLVLVLADNTFILQDVLLQRLCPWSETVPPSTMPDSLRKCPGPLQGLAFTPDNSSTMILYGQGFFVYVDIDLPVGKNPRVVVATAPKAIETGAVGPVVVNVNSSRGGVPKKRRRDGFAGDVRAGSDKGESAAVDTDTDNRNFTMVHRYRGLVHLQCLSGGHLVMVENPWLGVVAQLPDTLARKRYGT